MKKIERFEMLELPPYTNVVEVRESDLDELEQQRDEAVKILISIYTSLDNGLVDHYEDVKKLLENVTGQSWEEIKAGYKND